MISWIESLDVGVLQSLYAARSDVFVQVLAAITALGELTTVTVLAACLALVLYLRKRPVDIAGLAVAVFGSGLFALACKYIVARPRPDVLFRAITETGYSFPSGHATLSIALYGFLAYLIFRSGSRPIVRYGGICLTAVLILLIDFSRLYLGVHYLSDVVGGFVIGALFLLWGIMLTRHLSRAA